MERDRTPRRFDTPDGVVEAVVDDGVVRARGLRYARAARFAPPEPVAPASGVVDATRRGPVCTQLVPDPGILRIDFTAGLAQSEDCLRVTVTAPADVTGDAALPVLVWFHGGGYCSGGGDCGVYDPAALVREQRVVVVSVTNRLGPFGYAGGIDRAWNLGLLDQREALRWVRRNIAAFGGDPGRVTLCGESAGADAVLCLLVSDGVLDDGAGPLCHRAIVMSGPPTWVTGERRGVEAAYGSAIDSAPGTGDVDLPGWNDRVVAAARSLGPRNRLVYGPMFGHDPLPPYPSVPERLRRAAPRVDLLAGSTSRECAMFLGQQPLRGLAAVPVLGSLAAEALIRLGTLLLFERPATALVHRHRRAGGRAHRYRFVAGTAGNPLHGSHIGELPYLFPSPAWQGSGFLTGGDWRQVAREGRTMRRTWADFARTGTIGDDPAPEVLRIVR